MDFFTFNHFYNTNLIPDQERVFKETRLVDLMGKKKEESNCLSFSLEV